MRTLKLIVFLLVGFNLHAQEEAVLERSFETVEEFELALTSFENGEAVTAKQYFRGCLAGLILVENDLNLYQEMDDLNAPLADFTETTVRCLNRIKRTEDALKKYESQTWPLRVRLEVKTLNWMSEVKLLINTYLIELSEPLSRPEDTWNEENYAQYYLYRQAYDRYLLVDEAWIEFQYEFAEANDFQIEGVVQLNLQEESPMTIEEYQKDAQLLSDGKVTAALDYFEGVLGYVMQIDAYFMKFGTLDEEDAAPATFHANVNQCRTLIFDLRRAMVLYTKMDWQKLKGFNAVTEKWLNSIDMILDKYVVKLIDSLGRPDKTWTQKELDFYNKKYIPAYDRHLKIDQEWVDFQTEFAEANDFTLGLAVDPETILN